MPQRLHAYRVYEYMREKYSIDAANRFVEHNRIHHPIIYKKELLPYLR